MKKLLLTAYVLGLIFCSCKKEFSESNDPALTSDAKIMRNEHNTSLFDDSLWSCSANEWIQLTGYVTQHINEKLTEDKSYISLFESNFNQVTGKGNTSGKIYNGGGTLKGQVNVSLDESKQNVEASTHEKLHFICDGTGIDFDIISRYHRSENGEIKIDFVTDKSKDCVTN